MTNSRNMSRADLEPRLHVHAPVDDVKYRTRGLERERLSNSVLRRTDDPAIGSLDPLSHCAAAIVIVFAPFHSS